MVGASALSLLSWSPVPVFCSPLPAPKTPACFTSGLSTEGIYRVSGNKSEMESLQRQFDQGKAHSPAEHWRLEPVKADATAELLWSPRGSCSSALGVILPHTAPKPRSTGLVTEKEHLVVVSLASIVPLPQRRGEQWSHTAPSTNSSRSPWHGPHSTLKGLACFGLGPAGIILGIGFKSSVETAVMGLDCEYLMEYPQHDCPPQKALHRRTSEGTFCD